MKHTLSALVENKPGVLTRIAGLFARRGYNIDSLTVGTTENKEYSRMTIVVDGDYKVVEQVSKQLHKLIDVVKLSNITEEPHIERELTFIQVSCTNGHDRNDIMNLLTIFRGRVVDLSKDSMIIEVTGDSEKTDAILRALKSYGIKEVVRTGKIAMLRGTKPNNK